MPDAGARAEDGDIGPYDAPQAFSRPDYAADPYAPRPGEMRRRAVGPRAPCSRPPPARAARALGVAQPAAAIRARTLVPRERRPGGDDEIDAARRRHRHAAPDDEQRSQRRSV